MRFVALLRGINVGGKNKLPMKDLVGIFSDVGCTDVTSYIQSGNIIFGAPLDLAKRVPDLVTKKIQTSLGLSVPVVVRSSKELGEVSRNNPFLKKTRDSDGLHVAFLANLPSPKHV